MRNWVAPGKVPLRACLIICKWDWHPQAQLPQRINKMNGMEEDRPRLSEV